MTNAVSSSVFADSSIFAIDRVVGNYNKVGDYCYVEQDVTFGFRNTFGKSLTVDDKGKFGDANTFSIRSMFGNKTVFGDGNSFGNNTIFGNHITFGNYTSIGDDTIIGTYPVIGDGFKFGKRLTIDGMKVLKIISMSNVDGAGHKVVLVFHTKGVWVYYCGFEGPLRKFRFNCTQNGSMTMACVVQAVVEAVRTRIDMERTTGGWDEPSVPATHFNLM